MGQRSQAILLLQKLGDIIANHARDDYFVAQPALLAQFLDPLLQCGGIQRARIRDDFQLALNDLLQTGG